MSGVFKLIKILSLSIPCFFISHFYSSAQDFSSSEYAAPNVKSIWFEKDGWRLAYPFVRPDLGEELVMHFDVIDGNGGALWYRINHCDRDWNESDLFTSDYLEGYEENQITDYEPSFNTRVSYTHYWLSLPNDDIRFLVSGNYTITVWAYGEPDSPLLTRRFFVSEGVTPVQVTFRRPMKPGTTSTHQQSEITVSTGALAVTDPYRQVTLTIMQNGRWDRSHTDLAPDFVAHGLLEYNTLSDKTLMPGGNEFRFFDIKTIRQVRQNVQTIDFVDGIYHALLKPSEDREFRQYFYNEDFNGRYWVAMEESDEPDRDADYVWVYFTLPANNELQGGRVYVSGAFTGWAYGPDNLMRWNDAKRCYEASIMLKQGWYNYEYCFVPSGADLPEGFHFEGSHWETENDYLILVYFRDPAKRYDRLTGVTVANTRGSQ